MTPLHFIKSDDAIMVNIFNNMRERQWVTPCHLSLQIFMSKFETEVKDKFEYFPRVWLRYVDDIFAVFNTKAISLDNFVAKLNNRFPTIKFTYEVEHNEQLPFLDVLVIRNSDNKLEFDVYRKETAILRYIPNDSHHPFQHKMASFNSLIHRLLNFPLSKERFEHEKQLIKNIAKSNGYSVHLIDSISLTRKNVKSPLECWSLYFINEILAKIVENTNLYISAISKNDARERRGKSTDVCEIKAFLGLLHLSETLKSGRLNTKELCLRFDNLTTREGRKQIDKLAAIRSLFDSFLDNCKKAFTSGKFMKTLQLMKSSRQSEEDYIPSKPNRYGIKIFALVDAATSCTLNLEVYVGQQPEGPYKKPNDPCSIVLRLIEPISGTNRNVTCDNWFTSVQLVNKLFVDHRITYVGTVKRNKRELPLDVTNTRARPEYSSLFGFQKNNTIVSYIPKKYRNVIIISNLNHDDNIHASTDINANPLK
ncbi:hypothetical protein NQ318_013048 [Aromia moschata]|uniref:Reverse transcriptase domain-containing protein n=1 Tax=Aromia moschata TaxID=1265417 RepID=A0AAV8XLP7_9CUCU|nr:hypothetical protein NQ318_013048 [Aromia moschata]